MLFGIGFGSHVCGVSVVTCATAHHSTVYVFCVYILYVRTYVRILPVGMKANIVFSFRPHQQRWLARRLYLCLTAPGSLLCVRRLTTSGCALTSVLFYPFILLIILRLPPKPPKMPQVLYMCVSWGFFFIYLCTFFCTGSSSIKHLADV